MSYRVLKRLREQDLNLRPLGYEPNELPDCSIPRFKNFVEAESDKFADRNAIATDFLFPSPPENPSQSRLPAMMTLRSPPVLRCSMKWNPASSRKAAISATE